MRPKALGLAAVISLLCLAGVCLLLWSRVNRHRHSEESEPLSPRHDVEIAIDGSGNTGIWLKSYSAGSRKLLSTLDPDTAARNLTWSPDGRLATFESYNVAGHSPMTTTHVWVIYPATGAVRQIKLPPPNERFSTYFDRWVDSNTLRIRATLLEQPEDLFFEYRVSTGEIHGPVG